LFIWFSDATPTEGEREVYDVVNGVLVVAPRILEELQNYRGANEEIRQVSFCFGVCRKINNKSITK